MLADQYPSLWGPQDLFAQLALWAGAPAALVGFVVAALGLYKTIKDWFGFGKSAVGVGRATWATFVHWTSAQQRAAGRLLLFSVLTVSFSYMLAVLFSDIVELFVLAPSGIFSLYDAKHAATVTQWPPAAVWTVIGEVGGIAALALACMANIQRLREVVTFLGVLAMGAAWAAFAIIGICAGGTILVLLAEAVFRSTSEFPLNMPNILFTVTITVISALSYSVVRLLPKVHSTCVESFTPHLSGAENQARRS